MSDTLLQLEELVVQHRLAPTGPFGLWGAKPVRAVDGVSLAIRPGETVGIMGGSGSGKTTLAEAATLRRQPERGRILYQGDDLRKLDRKRVRRRLQMVRQDAREGLEMERSVAKQLQEQIREYQLPDAEQRIDRALAQVGLDPAQFRERTPLQMSGGQQQRLAIAKALALNPQLIALDEPVSGVDPRLQQELLTLFERLQKELGTAYLLISQERRVIARMAHRVGVMHAGRLVEFGPTEQVMTEPLHPYSRRFYGLEQEPLPAEDDMAGRTYQGCPWADHCGLVSDRCRKEAPALREIKPGHAAACHAI